MKSMQDTIRDNMAFEEHDAEEKRLWARDTSEQEVKMLDLSNAGKLALVHLDLLYGELVRTLSGSDPRRKLLLRAIRAFRKLYTLTRL